MDQATKLTEAEVEKLEIALSERRAKERAERFRVVSTGPMFGNSKQEGS